MPLHHLSDFSVIHRPNFPQFPLGEPVPHATPRVLSLFKVQPEHRTCSSLRSSELRILRHPPLVACGDRRCLGNFHEMNEMNEVSPFTSRNLIFGPWPRRTACSMFATFQAVLLAFGMSCHGNASRKAYVANPWRASATKRQYV